MEPLQRLVLDERRRAAVERAVFEANPGAEDPGFRP